jgi:hypothetical protein
MNVTDDQLRAYRDAVHRDDTAEARRILEAVREQDPSASRKLSDHELQKRLLLLVSRLLS